MLGGLAHTRESCCDLKLMHIREFRREDIDSVKAFTDRAIGINYYSQAELQAYVQRSQKDDLVASFVLVDDLEQVRGIRLTCAPGKWTGGKGKGLSPHLWKCDPQRTAYFQSLFVDSVLTGKGWGTKLSLKALQVLKKMAAEAVVCHSWKESPNDSSGRYLRGLGFEVVAIHPLYWMEIDYVCTRCGKPCRCTAEEMIKYL